MSVDDNSVSSPATERVDYDLFISYSRRDKDFVRQLWGAITQANQRTWVDWNDIPPITDWRQEIYLGIEAANYFVFILSPNSVASQVCSEELAHALKHGKQLVPIIREDVDFNLVHPELARINAIYFREIDDFGSALQKLLSAMETDLTHVRIHTRLLVRAREWENKEYDSSFLLRGSDLEAAEQWLGESASKDSQPTTLHREYINASRIAETERQEVELSLRRMTPQQYRNRQALLNKVNSYWVQGVLENSLPNRGLIALGMEERLDTVAQPWNMTLEKLDQPEKTIPQGTRVIAIFDQLGEGRTLLILGEPGAGKTTTLLELTRDLVNRAEQGIDYRIPVVFNLSSWAVKKQRVAEWLVAELNTKYQVPKAIGQTWVKEQQLLLLLDGLDEVKAESREDCIVALNAFQQEQGCEMVVTSRIKDYEVLSNRLNFQSAIYLRSLALDQVHQYLNSEGSNLTGLRTLIETDAALIELSKSPLMLNIMTLAYQGVAVEDLPKTDLVEERRKQLFDAYIERMFKRRGAEQPYKRSQAMHWLIWLAQRMVQESQTVFLIERMQPTWLETKAQRKLYQVGSVLIAGVIAGVIAVLPIPPIKQMPEPIAGLIAGSIVGLVVGWDNTEIKTVETLKWSWKKVKSSLFKHIFLGGIFGLIFGLILIRSVSIPEKIIGGLISGLLYGLTLGLIFGLEGQEIETKSRPNEGIWRTGKNAGIGALFGGLISGLILKFWLLKNLAALTSWLNIGLVWGLIYGLIFGGGKACIQHFTLRLILYLNNFLPWNYARFLDYATERIFLQKVGGGYIFIHRMLLEHFAEMELERGRR